MKTKIGFSLMDATVVNTDAEAVDDSDELRRRDAERRFVEQDGRLVGNIRWFFCFGFLFVKNHDYFVMQNIHLCEMIDIVVARK